jgi:hypothetical protein
MPHDGQCLRSDPVDPYHYRSHPSGIECIQVTEHFGYSIGNAIKYLWRAGLKDDALQDLRKAQWYINREIERIQTQPGTGDRVQTHSKKVSK